MMDFFKKEPVKRALRTFVQAAAGYIAVHIAASDFSSHDARMAFLVSVVAAGIAAAMNLENEGSDKDE